MSVDSTAILKIKGLDRRCLSRIVIAFRLSFRLRPVHEPQRPRSESLERPRRLARFELTDSRDDPRRPLSAVRGGS